MTTNNNENKENDESKKSKSYLVGILKGIFYKLMSSGVGVPLETAVAVDELVSKPEYELTEEEQAAVTEKVNNLSTENTVIGTETTDSEKSSKDKVRKEKRPRFPRARNTLKWFATAKYENLTDGENYRYTVTGTLHTGYILADKNNNAIAFRNEVLRLVWGGWLNPTTSSGVRDQYGRIQEQAILEDDFGFMLSPEPVNFSSLHRLQILIYQAPVICSHSAQCGSAYLSHTNTRFAPCVYQPDGVDYKMVIYAEDTKSAYSVNLDRGRAERIIQSDASDEEKLQQLVGTLNLPFEVRVSDSHPNEGAPGRWYKYNKSKDKNTNDKKNTLINIGETSSSEDLFNPTKE